MPIETKRFIDRVKECGFSDQIGEDLLKKINYLDHSNYENYKEIFDLYPHPPTAEVSKFKLDNSHKVVIPKKFYAGIDDLVHGCTNYLDINTDPEKVYRSLINHLNMVLLYEERESKHTHKGAIYFNIGQCLLFKGDIEQALLFIHRGHIEDYMKHKGIVPFPIVWSYQIITLDPSHKNPYAEELRKFINSQFLDPTFSFQQLYDGFLALPNKAPSHNFEWFDHVSFFHSLIRRIKVKMEKPKDIYDSILGNIISANLIGEICLLVESICKLKLKIKQPTLNIGSFKFLYPELKSHYKLRGYVNGNDFSEMHINSTLSDIFANKYKNIKTNLANSFYLTWGLRNEVHHLVYSNSILEIEFENIIKKQFDFLLDFLINFS